MIRRQVDYDLSLLNILVLEKRVLIRTLLTGILRELGVSTVQSTSDPEKAYRMFCAFPSDVVISDWTLDRDGAGFIKRLRDESSPNPFVPIIVTAPTTELSEVRRARDEGMTEYLAKPISPQRLYDRLVAVIEDDRPFVRTSAFFGPDRRHGRGEPPMYERRCA